MKLNDHETDKKIVDLLGYFIKCGVSKKNSLEWFSNEINLKKYKSEIYNV